MANSTDHGMEHFLKATVDHGPLIDAFTSSSETFVVHRRRPTVGIVQLCSPYSYSPEDCVDSLYWNRAAKLPAAQASTDVIAFHLEGFEDWSCNDCLEYHATIESNTTL